MPLEVREIGIRFSVEPDGGDEDGGSDSEGPSAAPLRLAARDRQNLVEECVRSVLDVLRRGRER